MGSLHAFARSAIAVVAAIVLCALPARAQSGEGTGTNQVPTKLHIVLGTQAVLHAADMFTTAHNLQKGGIEANPFLAPLSGSPATLVAVSSGINLLQIYTITKLYPHHPKVATAWGLILLGAEAYAVTNNVWVAGRLQAAPARTR